MFLRSNVSMLNFAVGLLNKFILIESVTMQFAKSLISTKLFPYASASGSSPNQSTL